MAENVIVGSRLIFYIGYIIRIRIQYMREYDINKNSEFDIFEKNDIIISYKSVENRIKYIKRGGGKYEEEIY